MPSSILQQPLVFVDVETTGFAPPGARVLELGALRVENGRITQQLKTLIHPAQPVPANITRLTGITNTMITGAPTFAEVAADLSMMLHKAIFVAHNVMFDYGFIKSEYERIGGAFAAPRLCTVRLSRSLYPQAAGHKLQDLIDRHGLVTANRHRAYDDAEALWQFWQVACREFGEPAVVRALARQLPAPTRYGARVQ